MTAARIGQGEVALARGDADTARTLLDAARTRAHRRGNAEATACSCYHLGQLARTDGDLVTAASLHHEALALRDDLGDRVGVADSLEALAGLALARGSDDKAARLFGAAEALRQATGCAQSRLATTSYETDVATLHERMEGDRLDSVWAEGRALPVQEVIWLACRALGLEAGPPKVLMPSPPPNAGWPTWSPRG